MIIRGVDIACMNRQFEPTIRGFCGVFLTKIGQGIRITKPGYFQSRVESPPAN